MPSSDNSPAVNGQLPYSTVLAKLKFNYAFDLALLHTNSPFVFRLCVKSADFVPNISLLIAEDLAEPGKNPAGKPPDGGYLF